MSKRRVQELVSTLLRARDPFIDKRYHRAAWTSPMSCLDTGSHCLSMAFIRFPVRGTGVGLESVD